MPGAAQDWAAVMSEAPAWNTAPEDRSCTVGLDCIDATAKLAGALLAFVWQLAESGGGKRIAHHV